MDNFQKEIDERANLALSNRFELLLFRLGTDHAKGKSELFGSSAQASHKQALKNLTIEVKRFM